MNVLTSDREVSRKLTARGKHPRLTSPTKRVANKILCGTLSGKLTARKKTRAQRRSLGLDSGKEDRNWRAKQDNRSARIAHTFAGRTSNDSEITFLCRIDRMQHHGQRRHSPGRRIR